jgi:hypothetical protein
VSDHGWTDADVARVQERLEELVRDLPGVAVEESFGHVGYLLGGRRFAWLFVDHHGDGRPRSASRRRPASRRRWSPPTRTGTSGRSMCTPGVSGNHSDMATLGVC